MVARPGYPVPLMENNANSKKNRECVVFVAVTVYNGTKVESEEGNLRT